MASHGPFKTKVNAEGYASKARSRGLNASVYKLAKGWGVSCTRK